MTQTHPITPPQELVASLRNSAPQKIRGAGVAREIWLVNHAYAAGADQELEACIAWLVLNGYGEAASRLRAHMRPKPPSLKEQALEALREAESTGCLYVNGRGDTIRRALEALDD